MIDELKALPSSPKIYLCNPIQSTVKRAADDPKQIRDSVVVAAIMPTIAKVAKKNKLEVIDLHPLIDPTSDMMQRDGIHPTAKGAKKIAETVADAIKI